MPVAGSRHLRIMGQTQPAEASKAWRCWASRYGKCQGHAGSRQTPCHSGGGASGILGPGWILGRGGGPVQQLRNGDALLWWISSAAPPPFQYDCFNDACLGEVDKLAEPPASLSTRDLPAPTLTHQTGPCRVENRRALKHAHISPPQPVGMQTPKLGTAHVVNI